MPFVFSTFFGWWYDRGTIVVLMRYADQFDQFVYKWKTYCDTHVAYAAKSNYLSCIVICLQCWNIIMTHVPLMCFT